MDDQNDFYPDRGCRYSSSCLACPLPICVEDSANPSVEYRKLRQLKKDRDRVDEMDKERMTPVQAPVRFGVSERTIFRILARVRDANRAGTD